MEDARVGISWTGQRGVQVVPKHMIRRSLVVLWYVSPWFKNDLLDRFPRPIPYATTVPSWAFLDLSEVSPLVPVASCTDVLLGYRRTTTLVQSELHKLVRRIWFHHAELIHLSMKPEVFFLQVSCRIGRLLPQQLLLRVSLWLDMQHLSPPLAGVPRTVKARNRSPMRPPLPVGS